MMTQEELDELLARQDAAVDAAALPGAFGPPMGEPRRAGPADEQPRPFAQTASGRLPPGVPGGPPSVGGVASRAPGLAEWLGGPPRPVAPAEIPEPDSGATLDAEMLGADMRLGADLGRAASQVASAGLRHKPDLSQWDALRQDAARPVQVAQERRKALSDYLTKKSQAAKDAEEKTRQAKQDYFRNRLGVEGVERADRQADEAGRHNLAMEGKQSPTGATAVERLDLARERFEETKKQNAWARTHGDTTADISERGLGLRGEQFATITGQKFAGAVGRESPLNKPLQERMQTSERIKAIAQNADGTIKNLNPAMIQDLVGATATLISGGHPPESVIHSLIPETTGMSWARIVEKFTNEPHGAGAQKFAQMFVDLANREEKVLEEQIRRNQEREMGAFKGYREKNPDAAAAILKANEMGGESAGGKVRVSNGKQTLEIDPADVAEAEKDGFRRL